MASIIVCPDGCDVELPELKMEECNPDVDFSEVNKIYFTNVDFPLTNWHEVTEWNGRLSNDSVAINAIRYMHVAGDKPPAESNETKISLCRTFYSEKDHTLNFDIDETSPMNNEAMRELECGGELMVWYATENYLYGGNWGVRATVVINDNITRGCTELNTIQGQFKWQSRHHPEKIVNPLF